MEPGRERGTAAGGLDGAWRVERTGGLLPPMVGVWKRIRDDRGETRLGSLLRFPIRVQRRGGRTVLACEPPLSALVDEISPGGRDLWRGRTTLGGLPVGRFRMTRIGYHDGTLLKEEPWPAKRGCKESSSSTSSTSTPWSRISCSSSTRSS